MQQDSAAFVGLDTSKMTISVALAEEGRQGDVRFLGDIDHTPEAVRRLVTKLAGKYAEQQKVAIRNVRREAMDDLKRAEKESIVSQDEHKRLEVEVQKLTDEAVKRVDAVLKIKEQEIMQV